MERWNGRTSTECQGPEASRTGNPAAGRRPALPSRNLPSSILYPQSPRAFTLIELLVVIAVIALLAGLVIGGAAHATTAARINRAKVELGGLSAAIDSYKAKKGYYPPCNLSNANPNPIVLTTASSLFYELTGMISTNVTPTTTAFHSLLTQEALKTTDVQHLFGAGGVLNSSPDPTEIQNFFPAIRKDEYAALYISGTGGPTYTRMTISIHGPYDFTSANSQILNFWHYASNPNATHNVDTYDLWVDILAGGKTNRISNWSKDPEIVNDWTP